MFSLRTKILTIVLAFLALIGAAFVLYSMFTTTNYKNLRLESISKTVEIETEKANKIIAAIERSAIYFALGGGLCYESQDDKLGKELALKYLQSFPVAIGGGFWYEPYAYKKGLRRAGFYAFFDETSGKARLDDTFLMEKYDYHNLNWYREIISKITRPYQVAWTKPYVDDSSSRSLMITAGSGIFDHDGRLIGISTIDWEIEDVVQSLSAIKPTKGSFILFCVPDNDYIISNTYTNAGTGASLKSIPWDIRANSFELDGVTYLTFKRVMNNGWLLSVQIPANEIFAEVESQNNRFSLIIAFSSVMMLGFAYFLISKLINTPLKRLTEDVAQLGHGNLDVKIDVKTKDELGLFAQAFNKMTVELKESIEAAARERAAKERIGAELNVASKIQASLLPRIFPPFPERPEFDIYATMLPAKEVGGDFYDFFLIDENRLAVVIADVSDKGVPAALFMVIAKTLIKNNTQQGKSPKEVFETVNNILCENNDNDMFVTAFMGILDIPAGRFSYVNAGHNPPLIKRAEGNFEWLPTEPGFVLAGMEGEVYRQDEIILGRGDMLYLYTDGVTEAVNANNQLFTEMKLLMAANKYKNCGLKDFLMCIKSEVDSFADNVEQADDITMLVIKLTGEPR